MMRLAVGYPEADEEVEILSRRRRVRDDTVTLEPVTSRTELLAMQRSLEDVHVADVTERYIVDVVRATRADHRVALGASPRGALALFKLARALAVLRRREFVLPDDVKAMAVPALAHRIILKPELWASRVSPTQVVQGLLAQVPVPGPATP
jgi:MoxR-like ATPase